MGIKIDFTLYKSINIELIVQLGESVVKICK